MYDIFMFSPGIGQSIARKSPAAIGIGIVAGPIMYTARARSAKYTEDDVIDRCYRLRRNKNQVCK